MRELTVSGTGTDTLRRLASVTAVLFLYAATTVVLYRQLMPAGVEDAVGLSIVHGAGPVSRNIAVRDGWFWVDGDRFVPLAVGWDPVRPGEVPWERTFHEEEIESDLARIREAGFNTVRTWAALSPEELALVEQQGLRVLQGVWVAPDGDFADPVFRRRTLAEVARAVESSRFSPAVLGYLVLNEPRASAVARAGLEETHSFLREVVATVRALDPSAPVGYASWPGMEGLDDELLDFVAFNVYPHRPRVVMDELGLGGYVAMLRRTVAAGRPLIISEFGISVSPVGPLPGRGGATEAEQAEGLVSLAEEYLAAGAVGLTVFQWSDGWWKDGTEPGDELRHDESDPEEWFGLVGFESVSDRHGQPRPALAAMAQLHRAVLLEPLAGQVEPGPVRVRVRAETPIALEVSVDGGERFPVELWAAGGHLWEGRLYLPEGGDREDVSFHFLDAGGAPIRQERRLLRIKPAEQLELSLSPSRLEVAPGARLALEVVARGAAPADRSITVAVFTEDKYNEDRVHVVTDVNGRARVTFEAPNQETMLSIMAFEDDPLIPPVERQAAFATVTVRAGSGGPSATRAEAGAPRLARIPPAEAAVHGPTTPQTPRLP